jgi:hypothetical protein
LKDVERTSDAVGEPPKNLGLTDLAIDLFHPFPQGVEFWSSRMPGCKRRWLSWWPNGQLMASFISHWNIRTMDIR